MTDQPKLSAAEEKADIARTNAYQAMAKQFADSVAASNGQVDLMGFMQAFKQLQIAVGVLTDLLLEQHMAALVPHKVPPPPESGIMPLGIEPHPLTREAFWLACARAAEMNTSLMFRELMSRGIKRADGSPSLQQ